MQRAGVVIAAACLACNPTHRLQPTTPFSARSADGVSARVTSLEIDEGYPDVLPLGTAVVEIENRSAAPVTIHEERLKWVGIATPVEPTEPGGIGAGAPPTMPKVLPGSLGNAGGGLGVGLGIVALGIVLVPVGLVYLIYKAATTPPETLGPGERGRYRIPVTLPDATVAQRITLGTALDSGRRALDVPLVDPTRPHGGWNEPVRLDRLGVRIGGGPITHDGVYSGTGGLQVIAGRRVGPLVLGAGGMIGVSWSIGPELSMPITLAGGVVEIAPTLDTQAGYTLVGRSWFVSPTGGLEITFPASDVRMLDWTTTGVRIGLYAKAGPTWLDTGLYPRWEVGFVAR